MLPKTRACVKSYDGHGQAIWMYWKSIIRFGTNHNTDIKKEFDSEPVYNKNLLKTNIKSYGDEVIAFHDKESPKLGSRHTCSVVNSLDSALQKDRNYYPQVFLKECKHIEKEKNC